MSIRAYKYRLYPNKEQEVRLVETLTTCRYLYNDALATRIAAYKETNKGLSYAEQCKVLTADKNDWQRSVYTQVLQESLHRLDKAYSAFFRRVKAGGKAGFPRFKPAQRYNSFCYPQGGFKVLGDTHLRLSKIGDVRIRLHRDMEGAIKTCTIVREVNQWYAILVCDVPISQTACEFPDAVIGVDVGIKHLATLSDGSVIANPRHTQKSAAKLARLQRQMARKKKGSKNRQKARIKVAKCHRKIKNQRSDFLHKESRNLANKYGLIVVEKLNVRGMVKNHCLAKSISDVAWSQFLTFLSYKAESAGGKMELVDARNTSQNCSGCGVKVPKSLSVRVHTCSHCGLVKYIIPDFADFHHCPVWLLSAKVFLCPPIFCIKKMALFTKTPHLLLPRRTRTASPSFKQKAALTKPPRKDANHASNRSPTHPRRCAYSPRLRLPQALPRGPG